MKTNQLFERLWEHGRTLRRVGLVLVMCLITITQAWGYTATFRCVPALAFGANWSEGNICKVKYDQYASGTGADADYATHTLSWTGYMYESGGNLYKIYEYKCTTMPQDGAKWLKFMRYEGDTWKQEVYYNDWQNASWWSGCLRTDSWTSYSYKTWNFEDGTTVVWDAGNQDWGNTTQLYVYKKDDANNNNDYVYTPTMNQVGSTQQFYHTFDGDWSGYGGFLFRGANDWSHGQTTNINTDASPSTGIIMFTHCGDGSGNGSYTGGKSDWQKISPAYKASKDVTVYFDNTVTNWSEVHLKYGSQYFNKNIEITSNVVPGTNGKLLYYTFPHDIYYGQYMFSNAQGYTNYWPLDDTHCSKYTALQASHISSATTLIPTANAQKGATTVLSGYERQVSISSYSHGTVTVSYTDASNTARSKTSGNFDVQQACVITVTAVADEGYRLTGLTIGGDSHSSGDTYAVRANTTVTATFTANTYNVRFNANDANYVGTATGSMSNQSHTYGSSKALTSNGFTRANHEFLGWATTPTGAVAYTNGQSVSNLSSTQGATVDLYAKWGVLRGTVYKFEVSSSKTSGNVCSSNTEEPQTTSDQLSELEGGTLTANSNTSYDQLTFSSGAYRFTGGNNGCLTLTLSDSIRKGDVIKFVNKAASGNKVFFRHTSKSTSTNEVTLDGNGSSTAQYVEVPDAFSQKKVIYIVRNSSNTALLQSVEIIRPYTITLDANTNGGTVNGNNSITIKTAGTKKFPRAVKSSSTFLGWATTADGTPVSEPYEPTGDITLYAIYDDCPSSGTVFSLSDIVKLKEKMQGTAPSAGTPFLIDMLYYSTETGGWAYAGNNNTSSKKGGITTNQELYLDGDSDPFIKVVLDCALQTGDTIKIASDQNLYVTYTSDRATTNTVNKTTGFVCTADFNGKSTFWLWRVSSTAKVTAIYVKRPAKYTVSYNNGGGSGTMTSHTVAKGADQALTANTFTKNGYTFSCWHANVAVKVGGSTISAGGDIADGATLQDISSDVTLTAQWTCTTPTFGTDLSTTQVDYEKDETATSLTVAATANSGDVSYQWYSNDGNDYTTPTTLTNCTTATYKPSTAAEGTTYYFCVATNTTGSCSTTANSKIAKIVVSAACDDPSASLDNGAYTVGGSALNLRTLWDSDNTTDDVVFTVTNANGTGATIAGDGYSFSATTAGTATISASQTSTGDYCDAAETASITVTVPTYAITYNKGSYGSGEAIAAGEKTYGVNFTLSSSTYTRDGYIQMGWSTSDGGAKAYDLGGTYTSNAALSLYPYWARKSTYTFNYVNQKSISTLEGEGWTFNSKTFDGSPADNEAYVNLVSAMNTAGLTAPKSNSMDDYSIAFAKNSSAYALYDIGYATAVSAVTGTFYVGSTDKNITFDIVYLGSDGSTVKKTVTTTHNQTNWGSNSVSETTLVRDVRYIKITSASTKWLVMSQLNITYANLATNHTITSAVNTAGYGSVSPSSITVADASTISISGNVLTCDGNTLTATPSDNTAQYTYVFSNWSGVTNGAYVTTDLTATANFTCTLNSYTIIWKNGDTTLETDENVDYGETPSYDGSTPTKASTAEYDYSFNTWDPAVSTVTGDATYSATFTQTARSYTLTWDANGGVAGSCTGSCTSGTVAYGTTLVAPGDPTRDGYDFAGWSPTPAATMPAANTTYTAQWATKYTVTFEQTAGYCATKNATGSSVNPITLPTPSGYGVYDFLGWYTSAGTSVGGAGDSYTPTAAITLYAKWQGACEEVLASVAVKSDYTINDKVGSSTHDKFDGSDRSQVGSTSEYANKLQSSGYVRISPKDGSSYAAGDVIYIRIYNGKSSTKTINVCLLQNDGSTHTELSAVSIDSHKVYEFSYTLTADEIFEDGYVQVMRGKDEGDGGWFVAARVIHTSSTCFSVTYDGNGATSGFMADPRQYKSGDYVWIENMLSYGYEKEGKYEFNGWNTKADGSGDDYSYNNYPLDHFIITKDTTLYAQWRIIIDENRTNLNGFEDLKHKDVRVTNGVTLTLTQDTTVRNMLVETGSTLHVAKTDGDEGVTLTAKSLALQGGYGYVNNAIKYDMPRVYIEDDSKIKRTSNIINFDIAVDNNSYYPFALPFDVNLKIRPEYNHAEDPYIVDYANFTLAYYSTYGPYGQFAIKTYNGQRRADYGSSSANWEHVSSGTTLKAGRGYALTALPALGYGDFAVIRFPMVAENEWTSDGEIGHYTDAKSVEHIKDTVHVTAYKKSGTGAGTGDDTPKKNIGWNLLGVPYMACYQTSADMYSGDGAAAIIQGKFDYEENKWDDEDKIRYVTVPNEDFSEYAQYNIVDEGTKLLPGWCFFVQIETSGILKFLSSKEAASSSLVYAPRREKAMPTLKTGIILSGNEASDKTTILVSDKYSAAEYEINADLEKMFGEDSYTLATYSLSGSTRLAFNAMSNADAANIIPIGYRAPADGEYTFSINPRYAENGAFESVNLIDYETGIVTDLMSYSYTFSTERTQSDTRFALNVTKRQDTTTDIENGATDASGVRKVLINKELYIILDGKMYDATGKAVK